MRNPERISEIITLLSTVWEKVPDWRFCQIIENIKRYSGKSDLFYVEDEEFERLIVEYFDLDKKPSTVIMDDKYTFDTGM